MGIQPEHAQLLARSAAVPGNGTDGACGQRVVAAQQNGQPVLLQYLQHGIMCNLIPAQAFGQVAQAIHVTCAAWIDGAGQIAQVMNSHAEALQCRPKLGHAQRIRSHGCPEPGGTYIGGQSDQGGLGQALVVRL